MTNPPSAGVPATTKRTSDLRRTEGRSTILNASITCMVLRGYHATSIRDIAKEARMTSAALYHHFSSKQDILRAIMDRALDGAEAAMKQAMADAGDDPVDRLRAVARAWVLFHGTHREEALIGATEIRSLEHPALAEVIARRDAIETAFRTLVQEGIDMGAFAAEPAPEVTARAIIAMGINVATWFDPAGSITAEELAREYGLLALRTVGCEPA